MLTAHSRGIGSLVLSLTAIGLCGTGATVAQPEEGVFRLPGPGRMVILDGPTPMIREFGPGRFTELLRPDYLRRDAKLFAEILELDSQQQAIIEILLDDYVQSFDAAAAKLKDAVKQSAPPMPQFARAPGDAAQVLESIPDMLGDSILLPHPAAGPGDEVTIWEGADGVRAMRIITATGDGPASPPPPPLPPVEGATEITREIQVETSLGTEPQVKINIVAKGPDGQSLIPPEVMQQITEKLRARIEQRVREQLLDRERGEQDQQAQPETPSLTTDQVASMAREFLAEKIRLRQQLATDAEMMLAESQQAQWDELERALRRQLAPLRARLSGEQVNLRGVAEQAAMQSIDPMLLDQLMDDYELQLDEALKVRDSFLEQSDIDRFIATRAQDADRQLQLAEQERALRLAVRTINETVAEMLAQSVLDAAEAARFRETTLQSGYTRVYRPTRTQRAFKEALALEDLAPEARATIAAMQQQYEAEVAAANQGLVQVTRQHEPDQPRRMIEFMEQMRTGPHESVRPPQDPVTEGINKRSDIGRRYLAQLRPLLTEDQLAKVPGAKPPSLELRGPGARVILQQPSTTN